LPRKGVIVYAGASDWFRGRKKTLSVRAERPYIKQNFGIYRWKYVLLAWKHGGKAKITLESIGEGIRKNYDVCHEMSNAVCVTR